MAYGIPEKLVAAIMKLYEGPKAKVVSPDGDAALFDIKAGVLQWDTLAPYLFAIVLDHAMRRATEGKELDLGFIVEKCRNSMFPTKAVTDIDFADDIALLSEGIIQLKNYFIE